MYMLYSRVHDGYQAFYGITQSNLAVLPHERSFLVFLRDEDPSFVIVPRTVLQPRLDRATLASDKQFKTHLYSRDGGLDLKLADVESLPVAEFASLDVIGAWLPDKR
jgi:hypothetical protein